MRDIRLPEISDKFIDISDINENTSGQHTNVINQLDSLAITMKILHGNISMILLQIVVLNVMKICQHY